MNNEEIYPVRLRLELKDHLLDSEEKRVFKKYADTNEEGTFIRDILIPSDMPLHNLHYAIQRLFGWQNSHLHCFTLEKKDFKRLTKERVKEWSDLVGILFQGVSTDTEDVFWDDDYYDGSIKAWLRKKYTGPYSYGGEVENYYEAKESVEKLLMNLLSKNESKKFFNEYYDKTNTNKDTMDILKKLSVMKLTLEELNNFILFENSLDKLLERLEIISILALPTDRLSSIKQLGKDSVHPVTRKIKYNYDFGDNWKIDITRVDNYKDLLDDEIITEEFLMDAEKLVINKHKPVCISKKGTFLIDDVGGTSGFADFLTTIYEGTDKEERKQLRNWASSLGWSTRKIVLEKML